MFRVFPLVLLAIAAVIGSSQAWSKHPDSRYQLKIINKIDVGPGQERIVFKVGRRAGRFTAVALHTRDRPVHVRRIVIEFGNGQHQDVRVGDWLDEGEISDVIDLKRDNRFIKNVVVTIRAWKSRRKTRIQLLGHRAEPKLAVIETVRVRPREDRVVLRVGRQAGRFEAIAFRALDRAVNLREAQIVFGNGDRQNLRIRSWLDEGETTELIDLRGERRFIKRIIVTVRPLRGRRSARIQLLGEGGGRHDTGGRPHRPQHAKDKWVLLGAQKAGMFKKDNDVYRIGKSKGRFKTIRVTARKHDIKMYGMQIVYGNGSTEQISLRGTLGDGRTSSPYDLKGRDRYIDRINFSYQSKLNFKGPGVAEIWGLRAN